VKQLEITTAQHVTIRYTLATLMDRILAYGLDLIIAAVISALLSLLYFAIRIFDVNSPAFLYFSVFPVFLFYHLIMESFGGGRSFGKKALNIKPVKKNGAEMTFIDYLMRWIFRLPDISLSLGSMAIIMISSSSYGQRLGDLLADTVVIKTEDSGKLHLKQILKMNRKQEEYKPIYPEVRQLAEKDILLIKEVSDRHKHFKNDASAQAFHKLIEKIEQELGIRAPQDKEKFLTDLITDYVFITR
jgi:uncharacterized RDD family membrane protein YckC